MVEVASSALQEDYGVKIYVKGIQSGVGWGGNAALHMHAHTHCLTSQHRVVKWQSLLVYHYINVALRI